MLRHSLGPYAPPIGPYAPPIDNLLSMSLRRDFECVEQFADSILDRLIMILQRAAIFGGKRGVGQRR